MRSGRHRLLAGASAVGLAVLFTFVLQPTPVLWPLLLSPTDGLREAAAYVARWYPPAAKPPVRLYARPGLVFYLGQMGFPAIVRCQSLTELNAFRWTRYSGTNPPPDDPHLLVADEVLLLQDRGPSDATEGFEQPSLRGGLPFEGGILNLLDMDPEVTFRGAEVDAGGVGNRRSTTVGIPRRTAYFHPRFRVWFERPGHFPMLRANAP
jgi:hypothetical protein